MDALEGEILFSLSYALSGVAAVNNAREKNQLFGAVVIVLRKTDREKAAGCPR